MKLRKFEWNNDFEQCRADADAGKFDPELANLLAGLMYSDYTREVESDKSMKIGWSISTSHTCNVIWTTHPRFKDLTERQAKVIFLAASDEFRKRFFGGQTPAEKREDLKSRISELCEMSARLELHIQKMTDDPENADELEDKYQNLFIETIRIYAD